MGKVSVLEKAARELLRGDTSSACRIIQMDYPFQRMVAVKRQYTDRQKMKQFRKDGFIDRYDGKKLVNPGILKVFSFYFPEDFPYHSHGKMDVCHYAYWEMMPSVDHIYPVAMGGVDSEENWVTTSMLHNMVKNNWTLEQLQWELHPPGNMKDWDGMTALFVELVESNRELLNDGYIKRWYNNSI